MTLAEFRNKTKDLPDDLLIVLSGDSEGNDFDTLHIIESNIKYKDGEIGYSELTDELVEDGFSEEDIKTDGQDCIVLWP